MPVQSRRVEFLHQKTYLVNVHGFIFGSLYARSVTLCRFLHGEAYLFNIHRFLYGLSND